ncbi:MAG: DNA mismatch repair endonuclease MutL [Ignavibacteriae bacterium]|nr:DNA mismatch repair endonuclease MutL [Ignavibacteriota bacterium]
MIDKSSNNIKILPDFIANQIAAGEVVQRPESVVKELVENSLDAGADSIAVIVKGAGKQLIHVYDNGNGMTKNDLSLSCKRHATSKIFSQEDLENINTFGFRGEALASISSIANVEIRTRTKNEQTGWKLIAEPMNEDLIEPCNTDTGTQVFVKNLFYNVPARRKFLKTDLTEFRYISDTMLKFALLNNQVRFTFYDDDVLIFDVHPETREKRISDILGEKTAGSLMPVSIESEGIIISGFAGQPHLAKQSRTGQYLYLNGRSIQSKSLSYAVFSAYEHLLEKNSNPFFIINLQVDPKTVDVNVHPQKHEVKFDDERYIFKLINTAITESLRQHNLVPEIRMKEMESYLPIDSLKSGNGEFIMVNKVTGEVIDNTPHISSLGINQDFRKPGFQHGEYKHFEKRNYHSNTNMQTGISDYDKLFTESSKTTFSFDSITPVNEKTELSSNLDNPDSMFWQLHNKYIFTQTVHGLMMVDQHAAHERVLYERAVKAMNKEYSYSQNLLFPINSKVTASELSTIKELITELINLGYTLNLKDPDTIELHGVPLDVRNGLELSSLKEIIDNFTETKKIESTNKRDSLAASYSCKAAIKAGDILTKDEMKKLLKDLFKCDNPFSCPHGRPVIIEVKLDEFDKRFGRI